MTAVEPDPAALAAPPGAAPLLRVNELAIRHHGADAATPARVSFDVAPGEVVLILGPSGSGKSTLALALNGLIPHDVPAEVTGTVTVDGLEASATPVAVLSTRVGMVFQDPDAQLVTGTVLDEVAFGPENLRLPVDDVLARTEAALRRVGLWERRGDNPDRLSGGGRQRLAIAAALAMGSPLLVLDEPTANLDPQGIEDVYDALAALIAEGDRAIVLVEHNLDAAVALVDRVVVLDRDGCLVVDGPVDTVLRERADELHRLGVWLPTSVLAALRLRRAGYRLDPLPLTPGQLRAALEAEDLVDEPAPDDRAAGSRYAAFGGYSTTDAPEPVDRAAGSRYAAFGGYSTTDAPEGVDRVAGRSPAYRDHHPRSGGPLDTAASRPTRPANAPDPFIRVRGLSLRRGRTEVLHDIDLDIERGSFTAIVGVNGAGKTSLIQAVAGVIPPPRGTVYIDGADIRRVDPRTLSHRVGFVFQNPEHQFISHTVYDELAHGVRHLPELEARERIERMLDRFGLTGKAQSHPFLLSGGQKRRLSVGTALIAGAHLLALDEPTFGQDRARADELLGLLRALNEEGTTVLIVTHDMQLVTEYAERTIVLGGGSVLAHGATADVFADGELIDHAGLRLPPLGEALIGLTRHPSLAGMTRLADFPGRPVV